MNLVSYIKKISFVFALIPGVALGMIIAGKDSSSESQAQNESSITRRAPGLYVRKNNNIGQGEEKSAYTERQLKALTSRLSKKPKKSEIEKEFQELLEAPYRQDNWYFRMAMARLFAYWGTVDPEQALEALMSLPGLKAQLKPHLMPLALDHLISEDPGKVAALFADSNTNLFIYTNVHSRIARQLTIKSPEESWKWMASLPSNEQISAMRGFFPELHRSHPEEIGKYVSQLTPSTEWGYAYISGSENLKNVLYLWADVNYEEAEKWAMNLEPYWQNTLLPSLLKAQAEKDPKLAIDKMLTLPPEFQPNVLAEIGELVANTDDPGKMSALLEYLAEKQLPDETWRCSFITHINPTDAYHMIKNLPSSALKERLIKYYINGNSNPNKDILLELVEQVQNKETKGELLEIIEQNH